MSKHVLLIDDDQEDAEIFSDALTELKLDFVLDHFVDGHKALEQLNENKEAHPNVIFLDINMPAISGWECLRQIKDLAFLNHIPIVMYSTSNLEREGLDAKEMGAAAFLTKPDNFKELKIKLSGLFTELL